MKNHHGLIVDQATTPPTCAGYIFNFKGHGAFATAGKVGDLAQSEIDRNNKTYAQAEINAAKEHGKAVFYLLDSQTCPDGFKRDFVGTWDGSFKFQIMNRNTSRHNIGGKRLDLYFVGPDGKNWHGVNIGDNQIVRCHRLK